MADIRLLLDDDFEEFMDYVVEQPYQPAPRRYLIDYENPMEIYTEGEFLKRYRFLKLTVRDVILPLIEGEPQVRNNRGLPLPGLIKVLIALRFYATASFQIVCADLSSLHQSTVSRIVKMVSNGLAGHLRHFVKFPSTPQQMKTNQNLFYSLAGFPGVSGCIDCTHVPIKSPGGEFAELYRNRKGWMSLNVQVVGGPRMEILDIVLHWPGSTHDARIFDNSSLKMRLEEGRLSGLLLGDSGYPQLPYLFTPMMGPNEISERRYNTAHKRTRNLIERLFGIWKRRFPCLSRKLLNKISTTTRIIASCAVLQNIAVQNNDPLPDDVLEEQLPQVPVANAPQQDGRGRNIRNVFI